MLKTVLVIVVVVVIAFLALSIYFNVLSVVRDVVIVMVAFVWILAGALVAIVAWFSLGFVKAVRGRAEALAVPANELLGQAKETLGTAGESARIAKEAVTFVSDRAVMPTIAVVSAVVGVRRFFGALFNGVEPRGSEAVE